MFLEECKHVKEKKIPKYIIDYIEVSDSDKENSDEENSDEENSNEENSKEENSDKENFDEENKKNTNITNKNIFIIFFIYIKMVNKYQKHKEKL